MLALTRRVGEEIVSGEPLTPIGSFKIVEVHGDQVLIAFDFPRDVPINRREIADAKAQNGTINR